MVQLFVTSKPILVHGDRVRHLTLKEHDAAAAALSTPNCQRKLKLITLTHQIQTQRIRKLKEKPKDGRLELIQNRISQSMWILLGTPPRLG